MSKQFTYKWNEKSVKADVFDRYTQQVTRQTLSPKEIVDNPTGKQPEVIIMACAKILSEFVKLKEEESERILNAFNSIKKDPNQLEMFSENE